jgi:ABC-type sugar transport system substrate-binding protein
MGRGVRVAAIATVVIPMLLVAPAAAAAETPDCSTVPPSSHTTLTDHFTVRSVT